MQIAFTPPNGQPPVPSPVTLGRMEMTSDRPFRVFLLEDNLSNAFVIESYLEEMGLPAPDIAGTIAEAYTFRPAILSDAYDLVMCDVMLPDGESFGFMIDLLTAGFDRIVIHSARGTAPMDADNTALGRLLSLPKPLSFNNFRDAIHGMMHAIDDD